MHCVDVLCTVACLQSAIVIYVQYTYLCLYASRYAYCIRQEPRGVRYQLPGVSKKSDEFKTCIFPVVLVIEPRIGYQVKACSIIFSLRADPMPRGTLPGRAEDMFAVTPVSLEAQFSSAQRGLRLRAAHGGVHNLPLISPPPLDLRARLLELVRYT